jgi:hypothetical protein
MNSSGIPFGQAAAHAEDNLADRPYALTFTKNEASVLPSPSMPACCLGSSTDPSGRVERVAAFDDEPLRPSEPSSLFRLRALLGW